MFFRLPKIYHNYLSLRKYIIWNVGTHQKIKNTVVNTLRNKFWVSELCMNANVSMRMNDLLCHISIKYWKLVPLPKLSTNLCCREYTKYQIQKPKSYIKKSNQISHQEITCSNSATEFKNINRSRQCNIITVDF